MRRSLVKNFRIQLALLMEMIPGFLLGMSVFLLIILMFQILRLTEFALIHGVDLPTLAEIILYICISMLPALFPMSLLFSILWTYGRLSNDSEIVALRACGLSMSTIMAPALTLSLLIGFFSAQTSFELAPWGNRQFEVLFTGLKQTKAAATIKEGTFSEGLFDLVVYANKIDSNTNLMRDIFIYDERDPQMPLTIIAKIGELQPDPELPGHRALLHLANGSIHRKAETHTKINFETFDVHLSEPFEIQEKQKSAQSWTWSDIQTLLNSDPSPDEFIKLKIEWHKRMAIAIMCVIFGLMGVALGVQPNRRAARSSGFILCLVVIIGYWVLYVTCEGLARGGQLPPSIALWLPNIGFGGFSFYSLKKVWD
jgi:lipopolysaccharide export system permease protein